MLNTLGLTNAQNASATNFDGNVTHIATGDNAVAPTVGDTALGNETFRGSLFGESLTENIVTKDLRISETENNGNTVNEIGTFDAASTGNMSSRKLTTSVAKTSSKVFFYRLKTTFVATNT